MGELIDKAIQADLKRAKASGKMGRLSAGHQLTLLVTSEGVGRWQQRYSFGSNLRTASFGSYPTVSLAEATAKAIAARDLPCKVDSCGRPSTLVAVTSMPQAR